MPIESKKCKIVYSTGFTEGIKEYFCDIETLKRISDPENVEDNNCIIITGDFIYGSDEYYNRSKVGPAELNVFYTKFLKKYNDKDKAVEDLLKYYNAKKICTNKIYNNRYMIK